MLLSQLMQLMRKNRFCSACRAQVNEVTSALCLLSYTCTSTTTHSDMSNVEIADIDPERNEACPEGAQVIVNSEGVVQSVM